MLLYNLFIMTQWKLAQSIPSLNAIYASLNYLYLYAVYMLWLCLFYLKSTWLISRLTHCVHITAVNETYITIDNQNSSVITIQLKCVFLQFVLYIFGFYLFTVMCQSELHCRCVCGGGWVVNSFSTF